MQPSDKTAAVAIVSQESPLVQVSKDFALTVSQWQLINRMYITTV